MYHKKQATIAGVLEKVLGRKIEISNDVDVSLIGGVVIRAGDTVIDASIRGRLKALAMQMTN